MKGKTETLDGIPVEMIASRHPSPEQMASYERVLGDAMAGDPSHFACEDYVEEAWRIVDPVLQSPPQVQEYEKGAWGPTSADISVMPPGGSHDPTAQSREDVGFALHSA